MRKYKILFEGGVGLMIYLVIAFIIILPKDAPAQATQWNVATLKEYVDQQFVSTQLAVDKAFENLNKRFDNTNEWRNTVESLGRTYMPRLEQESIDKSQNEIINNQRDELNKIQNVKQGGNIVWAYVLGGAGFIISLFSIKDRLIKPVNK